MKLKYQSSLIIIIMIIIMFILGARINQNSKITVTDLSQQNDHKLKILSKILNNKVKELGQLSCTISQNEVSVNGGWCSKISGANSSQHLTDDNLVSYLNKFFKGKNVASFGDGPGIYKKKLLELGEVASYDAFDGAPFTETTTEGRCKFLDLSVPIYHLNSYDWVISMEVAEHIPKAFESVFLDNVCRHAEEGVILSWAVPGQGGHSHINNQPIDYVIKQMKNRGFEIDQALSKEIKTKASFSWLKSNLNVFKRNNLISNV